jgi:hypothetical protein
MSEARLPEQMPTHWWIKSFAYEKGFGTLVHESGEEALFNIDVWDLGSWKPSRRDAVTTGPTSPLLPKEGEPVQVRWKRSSISGKTVPALVQPSGRVSANRKEYKLASWLKGLQRTGRFAGLTAATLRKAMAKLDEDRAEEWRAGEPREAGDFAFLLMDLANLHDVAPEWVATHASWLYSDDHRWDRTRARKTLPGMLGLKSVPEPADGGDESLSEYAAKCNAEAERSGSALRLHEVVALDGDAHVLVAMTPTEFTSLVEGGDLAVD